MILGIGTDIVQVSRFETWAKYPKSRLLKIFSEEELSECSKSSCNDSGYSLQYLASRFSAKESFFKAFSASLVKLNLTQNTFSLLFICQNVEVIKSEWDIPELKINWKAIENKVNGKLSGLQVDLSISHEKDFAISFVIISK